jgi:hypothetical protein
VPQSQAVMKFGHHVRGRYLRRYKQHAFCDDQWKYSKREKQELESEGKSVPNSVYDL